MTFTELAMNTRSYRGFDRSCRLSHEELEELVKVTRYCPSSGNIQALRFHISEDEEEVSRILGKTRWAGRMKEPRLPHPGKEPTSFISIWVDTTLGYNDQALEKDAGIVAYAILLRAVEMGFGGCMLGCLSDKVMHDLVNEPESMKFKLLVALGKPDETIVIDEAPIGYVTRDRCYYRDENDIHHVWKRPYDELFI